MLTCLKFIFQVVDAPLAKTVRKSIERHLWYLTEQLVTLALFDRHVDLDTKSAIATQLQKSLRPPVFTTGKPVFPDLHAHDGQEQVSLTSLVGSLSWMLFDLLGASGHWLALPPNQWEDNDEYRNMKSVVSNIAVVNDAAERSIKDIQDFANTSNDSGRREDIVLVTESNRRSLATFTKRDLNEGL